QNVIWSNLALHWHPEPHRVFSEWHHLLVPGGLLMFSAFGNASSRELRDAMAAAGLPLTGLPFVAMHAFGNLLLAYGCYDSVMDQETITLTYQTAEKLLKDVWVLGGNPVLGRHSGGLSRHQRDLLLQALNAQRHMDGSIHLTVEVAYGHA